MRQGILVVSHLDDKALWRELLPHFCTLEYRFSETTTWRYHSLPLSTGDERAAQEFFTDLQESFLFVPCTSATSITALFQIYSSLTDELAHTSILPVPLRAVAGVRQVVLSQPLAAYQPGHERDLACVEIITEMEKQLRKLRQRQQEQIKPLCSMEEMATTRLLI